MDKKKILCQGVFYVDGPLMVHKKHPDASDLMKQNETDVGYNLTIIGRENNRVDDTVGEVNTFTTGLYIKPPKGFHIEIIATDTLNSTGYLLSPSPYIINPSNEDDIIIPLYKYSDKPDLELPLSGCLQVVLRETQYVHIMDVKSEKHNKNKSEEKHTNKKKNSKSSSYMF